MAQNCGKERDDEYLSIPAKPPPRRGKILPVKVLRPKQPGGYDCEFVENPPSAIQTECSICLQILHVPKIIDCCGHNFCGACIDRIVKDGKFCPLCNEKKYSLMRNKGLERALNEFDVKCSYFKEGCRWTGKLGDFAFHLNSSGSSSECGFVEEICWHGCGDYFERRFLQQHQDDECPKRPFSCECCHDFSSTFEDVAFSHYSVCGSYPIPCPNKCDFPYAIERRDLRNHVDNDCPLAEVSCDFSFAGCEVRLPRKDMPDHLKENVTHLSLMAAKLMEKDKQIATLTDDLVQKHDDLVKKHDDLVQKCNDLVKKHDDLEGENQSLKSKVAVLHKQVNRSERTIQSMTDRLQHNVKTFRGELTASMDTHRKELDVKLNSLCTHSVLPPCSFVVTKISENDLERWYSEPFYTHPRGYKMCFGVYANGIGVGEGSHVSVFVYLMQGIFDDLLKWPFQGEITIQLLNQSRDGGAYGKVLPFSDQTPDLNAGRVRYTERGGGWGFHMFIAKDQLKPKYLVNGLLHFRIPIITCTSV